MRWKIFDGALNADILIDFLRRLIKGAPKKATSRHLRSVQRQPERIRRYFEHGPMRYAA